MIEPDADVLARHADQLPVLLGRIVRRLDRLDRLDYAGTGSGGAIDTTTTRRAESRPPGRLARGTAWRYAGDFEKTGDLRERWRIVRDAGDELVRREALARRPTLKPAGDAYVVEKPGRPRTKASGRVLARASEASSETPEALRASVGQDTPPHPAVIGAALAEVDAGASVTAVARELGCCRKTIHRWRNAAEGVSR